MPDPGLYLLALAMSGGVSALVMLAGTWRQPSRGQARISLVWLIGIGLGLALGWWRLRLLPAWPPVNGLGRLLLIVLPAAFVMELVAGTPRAPAWLGWLLRVGLCAATGRILLHDSVHLQESHLPGVEWPIVAVLAVAALLLAGVWILLARLSKRIAGESVVVTLGIASLCAGLLIMLAGYVSGGAAALPLAGALCGTAAGACFRSRLRGEADRAAATSGIGAVSIAAVSIGVVGLFGLLFVGRFFGGISNWQALTVFLAPLLGWITELPGLRWLGPWRTGALRVALVAIPLLILLAEAKREFDREMAPLLGTPARPREWEGAKGVAPAGRVGLRSSCPQRQTSTEVGFGLRTKAWYRR